MLEDQDIWILRIIVTSWLQKNASNPDFERVQMILDKLRVIEMARQ